MNVSFKVENCSISIPTLVAACDGCPQQPALDEEGDYRRKVPIDSVRRVRFTQSWCESSQMSFRMDGLCQWRVCANHSGGYANP